GGRLLAPLDGAAHLRGDDGRHPRHQRTGRDPAGGPDVPCQRVGPRPRRRRYRGHPDHAGRRPVGHVAGRPDRERGCDRGGRRAHHLDGCPARVGGSRRLGPTGHPVWWFGRPPISLGGLPGDHRPAAPPGLGHDGDQPTGRRLQHQVDPGPPRRRCQGRSPHGRGAGHPVRGLPDRRPGDRRGAAVGRGVPWRTPGPRALGGQDVLQRRPVGRVVHGRRLAEDGRCGHGRRGGLHTPCRPHQGPHQVGRRVDQLGGTRERDHGPSRRGGGRRHRHRFDQVGRAGHGLRGPRRGYRPLGRRHPDVAGGAGREVVDARPSGVHRRGPQD
ncbi:uncharacterized protein METZ01_LOCUS342998, partial [marine metagenome]